MSKKDNKKTTTAVEWLAMQLYEQMDINGNEELFTNSLIQAKAMEKEQHQITFDMGYEEHIVETWGEEDPKGFEDYFTETYNH